MRGSGSVISVSPARFEHRIGEVESPWDSAVGMKWSGWKCRATLAKSISVLLSRMSAVSRARR